MSFTFVATGLTPDCNTTGLMVGGTGIYSAAENGFIYPYGMALDATASNVYITDQFNNRVQKWVIGGSTGVTVAGQSSAVAGTSASDLHVPCGIVLDSTGGFYVADSNNNRVQYWSNGSSTGSTIAGTGKLVRDTLEVVSEWVKMTLFYTSSNYI
jgi:sugar lactone lactonase YvrE